MMRREIVFALALGGCLLSVPASAQGTPAGSTAAPDASAAPAASGNDVIRLHMPVHHRVVHAHASPTQAETAAPAETPSIDTIGADTTAPAAPAPVAASAETPSPQAAPSAKAAKSSPAPAKKSAPAIPFTFGEDSGAAPSGASAPQASLEPQAAASSRPTKIASLPPKPGIPKPTTALTKPVKEAARTKDDGHGGFAKRGAVLFDKGKSSPSPQQFDGLKLLAGDLSTALEGGRGPVQLEAYAGARGDKSSTARRLSLERAIAVRQLLIDDGLPSNRIIVRAMGGADDNGPDDRVDVFVRSS